MVFFYLRLLARRMLMRLTLANGASLVATRSHFGSCVIDAIHYRNAASLPQICLSPLSNLKGCLKLCFRDSLLYYEPVLSYCFTILHQTKMHMLANRTVKAIILPARGNGSWVGAKRFSNGKKRHRPRGITKVKIA